MDWVVIGGSYVVWFVDIIFVVCKWVDVWYWCSDVYCWVLFFGKLKFYVFFGEWEGVWDLKDMVCGEFWFYRKMGLYSFGL